MFKTTVLALVIMLMSLNLFANGNKVKKPVVDELEVAESFLEDQDIADASILLEIDESPQVKTFPTQPIKPFEGNKKVNPKGGKRSLAGAGFSF